MPITGTVRAALCCAALGLAAAHPATADVILSTSSDPHVALERNLGSLLGSDRGEVSTGAPAVAKAPETPRAPAPGATESLNDDLSRLLGSLRPELQTDRRLRRAALAAPALAMKQLPGKFRRSTAYLATLPKAEGDAQWRCLAQALYFEARGESVEGIFAVAEVILNRVDSGRFPDTVCKVVNQGTGKRYQCQFSYTCDGYAETIREPRAWRKVGKIARLMLDGAPRELTDGATYYHTRAVKPRWASKFAHTADIGAHRFYRQG